MEFDTFPPRCMLQSEQAQLSFSLIEQSIMVWGHSIRFDHESRCYADVLVRAKNERVEHTEVAQPCGLHSTHS